MTDSSQPKPPLPKTSKSEKVFFELPGVFKVGLVNEDQLPAEPHPAGHVSNNAITVIALVATAILCGMFVILGRRKRRANGKP